MGIGYNTAGNFSGGFFAIDTQKPIVGSVASGSDNIEQAIYSIQDTEANRVLGGGFVQINLQNGSSGLNPMVFNISAKSTALANVDGVLLWSGTDISDRQGSVPVTQYGLITNFARLHSRVGVWLKVYTGNVADLQSVTIGQALTIDTVNGGVKKSTGGTDILAGAVLGSQIVEGQEIVWDNANNVFKAQPTSVVLVYLY